MSVSSYEVNADQARRITDRIKIAVEGTWDLIREAYESRVWAVLGYRNWDDYCVREFGASRIRLPREDRQEVVASLRESGLSIRAIASATGIDEKTVGKDLRSTVGASHSSEVIGSNGKHYRPTAPKPKPPEREEFEDGEAEAIIDTLQEEYGDDLTDEDIEQAADECVESKRLPVQKPDLGGGISHPARFSDALLPVFADLLKGYESILDPFAGTGRIHQLHGDEHVTLGIELEPEWAALHERTQCGSALDLPFDDESFDAICTSPTYGNRLADSYNSSDPHLRRSYRFDLGRELHEDNSGAMQWGPKYREFHETAWYEAVRVLLPNGRFVLNIKDHYRDGEWQDVSGWHVGCLQSFGMIVAAVRIVATPNLSQGSNSAARVPGELVIALNKET